MRYLCLNQGVRREANQVEPIVENKANQSVNQSIKRTIAEAMDHHISEDDLIPTKKAKRFRSAFTTEQIKYLDAEFRKYPYIGSARRKEVSTTLGIPERAVKIWFQNRRMKEKKDVTTHDTDCDEHKHSRKIDVAITNDQLNNECTVTSTNNRHYASLPLMSPKQDMPKNDVAIKKENETVDMNDELSKISNERKTPKSPEELSLEQYKQYCEYFGKKQFAHYNTIPDININVTPNSITIQNSKNEVSSTSPYERLPQDLSRKRKPLIKPTRPVNPPGNYFPLNLKKYYAQPSLPVGGNMLWKPIQVLPLVSTGASAVSISNSHAGSLTVSSAPPQSKKECQCECRCHPPSPPANSLPPVLLQQGAPNPLAQYVLTALPLQNPYYKYQ